MSDANGVETVRRSPYGERGLKSGRDLHSISFLMSLSLRRAWIEIANTNWEEADARSLSLRRAWIEISRRVAR